MCLSTSQSKINSPLVLNVCKFLETWKKRSVVCVGCLLPFDCSVNTMRLEIPACICGKVGGVCTSTSRPFCFHGLFQCIRREVLISATQLLLQSESCACVTLKNILLLGGIIGDKLHSR